MKKNSLILFTILFAFVLCFSFNVGVNAAPEGTLRIASSSSGSGFTYEAFEQIQGSSFWGWALYDPIMTFDENANAVGVVAKSWKLSKDGKTWTFDIRKGIIFHNGDALTAHDVKFSIERFIIKESTNAWSRYIRDNLDSIEVVNNYRLLYKAKKPEPFLTLAFANVQIEPKKYFEKLGQDEFRKAPVGSGPYKFAKLVHSTSFEMEANAKYWGRIPAFKTVIELSAPEESTRIAMLKSGEVDIAQSITLERQVELEKLGYRLQETGMKTLANINFLGTWVPGNPTSDIRVRKAMSFAVNRQEMCDTFYKGIATPGGRWMMDEDSWGWDPSLKADPYDPDKAKALLKEAGYPEKFKNPVIKIYTQTGDRNDMSQMLQGYWAAVGIQADIVIVDSITYLGYFFKGQRDPAGQNIGSIIPWVFPNVVNSIYHSGNMYCSKGVHATGFDAKADELYDKALYELNVTKAKKYYTEFQKYGASQYINVGIVQWPSNIVVGPKVGEFAITNKGNGFYYLISGIQHSKK